MESQDFTNAIRLQRVRIFYRSLYSVLAVTIVNAGILCLILIGQVDPNFLAIWFSCIFLVSLFRLTCGYLFKRNHGSSDNGPFDVAFWEGIGVVGAGLAGAVWGSAAIYLMPETSEIHRTLVVFVLGGMVVGGITTLYPIRLAFIAFTLPAMVPSIIIFATFDSDAHRVMALFLAIFSFFVMFVSHQLRETLNRSLVLRFENTDLVENLS